MELVTLGARDRDWRRVRRLYASAFPPEERAPFFFIRMQALRGKAEMLAARENGRFVGFAYLVRSDTLAYLFFLAVDADSRGRGYGSEMLRRLKETCAPRRLFLACEQLDTAAENYDERVRRHAFYLRNGFHDLPCRIKEADVIYSAMAVGDGPTAREYDEIMSAWMGWRGRRIEMKLLENSECP